MSGLADILSEDASNTEAAALVRDRVRKRGLKLGEDFVEVANPGLRGGYKDAAARKSRITGGKNTMEKRVVAPVPPVGVLGPRMGNPYSSRVRATNKEEPRAVKASEQKQQKKRTWNEYVRENSPPLVEISRDDYLHESMRNFSEERRESAAPSSNAKQPPVRQYEHSESVKPIEKPMASTSPAPSQPAPKTAKDTTPPTLPPPPSFPAPASEPALCKEQQDLVALILSGRNVFYTGSAGCGKSTVLKAFVARLQSLGKRIKIIAPTGRAALDINGQTFWTYAGWTPDSMRKGLPELKKASHAKFVHKRLWETDVLVVDEVSMLENHHFERLNEVMKESRGRGEAFGGVQMVVTGDFCQLPPVKPFQYCLYCGVELQRRGGGSVHQCKRHGEWKDTEKWAFCSNAWDQCDFAHINLTTIHRQSDAAFISLLQKCRLGQPFTPAEETLLLTHPSQTSNAVKLFSTRDEVRTVNSAAFNRLPTQKHTYRCLDHFVCNAPHLEARGKRSESDHGTLLALREHRLDPVVELKQGMQVVLLVNLDIGAGLVNGSQGVITGFVPADASTMPKPIEKDSKGNWKSNQPPNAVLAGEHADLRASNIAAFVSANSPPKSPFPNSSDTKRKKCEWPIVLFQNRLSRPIYADCRVNSLGDEEPYSFISRTQIPLVAGWAMTVHKSQGMTLNRVIVDLARSFEEGQVYVALSRARGLEGLRVEGLGRGRGRNEEVSRFLGERFGVL